MNEDQNTEWKESWRDEFLKALCGFANAEGGTLVIGRDDAGRPVGVRNAAKLLEDLPNKARDVLGIMVDVRLRRSEGKQLVEVRVEPYPGPISCRGEYYQRSGSTTQMLKGAALDRFLLRRYGRTWDGFPMPGVALRNLSKPAFETFRQLAKQSRRMDATQLKGTDASLLEKLNLMEGKYLKRAALLLFHPDPEKFVTGAYVKIGYFRTDTDLVHHDEVHGDLFTQARMTVEILQAKYLKAAISYRGIDRIESLPMPEDALREVLLNALIHRDYAVGAPIQIRVYPDKLRIWNPGHLPDGWTVDKLLSAHSSKPFNPEIAGAFFRAGEIEAWGRGIQRIFSACKDAGTPEPRIEYEAGDLWFEFPYPKTYLTALAAESDARGGDKGGETRVKTRVKTREKTREKILSLIGQNPEIAMHEVARSLGITTKGVEWQVRELKKSGHLQRIGPAKGGQWKVIAKPASPPIATRAAALDELAAEGQRLKLE